MKAIIMSFCRGATRQRACGKSKRETVLDAIITDFSRLQPGIPGAEAITVFKSYCNHRNTLFAPDHWFKPFLERLERALPAAITADHVNALREALLQQEQLTDVLRWLENEKGSWEEFKLAKAQAAEVGRLERIRKGFFPREDVEKMPA